MHDSTVLKEAGEKWDPFPDPFHSKMYLSPFGMFSQFLPTKTLITVLGSYQH